MLNVDDFFGISRMFQKMKKHMKIKLGRAEFFEICKKKAEILRHSRKEAAFLKPAKNLQKIANFANLIPNT